MSGPETAGGLAHPFRTPQRCEEPSCPLWPTPVLLTIQPNVRELGFIFIFCSGDEFTSLELQRLVLPRCLRVPRTKGKTTPSARVVTAWEQLWNVWMPLDLLQLKASSVPATNCYYFKIERLLRVFRSLQFQIRRIQSNVFKGILTQGP